MTVTERFIGKAVPRKEDPELITGQASYVDNMTVPGMVWMALVRPPYVHARIERIDTKAAAAMPGVLAVFTGADLEGDFAGSLPMVWPITDDIKMPVHWPLTKDKIRFNGDAVAVVLAETRAQAEDAAEAVTVSVQELPPVLDLDGAGKEGATLVHEDLGTNAVVHWAHGGAGDQTVFETAEVVVEARYEQPRVIPNPMEPRSVLVQSVPAMGEFTVISATQIPHILKVCLSMVTGVPEQKLRVIAPDVGGGFGGKLNVYAEEALALALCRKLGRPVKWTETRSENYVAMIHGRGTIHDCTLAGTKDGKIVGVKFVEIADMGAYYQLLTPGIPELGAWVYMGPYDPTTYWYEFTGVMTNRTPTDAYRGAGRPEATFVLERLVDLFAQRIGMDPAEVRRKNLVPKFLEARPAISGLSVDSGDYHTTFQMALDLVHYDERRKEQARRRAAGDTKQLGIGICTYIEMCGLAPSEILGALKYVAGGWDAATIECLPTGKVIVKTGTSPHGQGHETSWAQVVADGLGIHVDDVEVLHGDTAVTPLGMDTYGSRSASVGGAALHFAMEKIREKARKIAAHEMEVAEADVDWVDGAFRVKGAPDKARTIPQLAFSAWTAHSLPKGTEPHLNGTAVYDPPNFTWPGGAHICVVEVDVETGQTEIVEYVGVDDCGTIINPMIVEGQVHGGVAQGVAEALYEEAVYDEQGNLTTSSLVQYLVPSANEIPTVRLGHIETPSTTNPLGVKGIGEAGTIASPPAVVNAVEDAIAHLGVTTLQKPASPERVWRAIRAAKAKGGLQ